MYDNRKANNNETVCHIESSDLQIDQLILDLIDIRWIKKKKYDVNHVNMLGNTIIVKCWCIYIVTRVTLYLAERETS